MTKDRKSQPDDATRRPPVPPTPPEGPHARPGLIDGEKTPGSGMFPEPGEKATETPAG